jgi:hypothetical protein
VPAALAVFLAIVTGATGHTQLLWIAYGAFCCSGTLAFAALARNFPVALAGRANTALNVVVFLGAFGIQWGVGAAVDLLRARGADAAAAHRGPFWAVLVAQALSYAWFVASGRLAAAADRGTRPEPSAPPGERYGLPDRQPGGPP